MPDHSDPFGLIGQTLGVGSKGQELLGFFQIRRALRDHEEVVFEDLTIRYGLERLTLGHGGSKIRPL